MGASFHFFTEPTKLADQAADKAFGPATAVNGKDRFRVTDVHAISTGGTAAKAYAVCHGRICVQAVRKAGLIDSLTLILRPSRQPPFEFPYVEYYIYRGLRPSSLLKSTVPIDLADAGADLERDLIGYIHDQVLTERPKEKGKKPIVKPPVANGANLGLDRDPAITADTRWGDDQPLDHLFRYRGAAEVPTVGRGWTLGEFGDTFGFEIVVQHYGAQPTIGWARSAEPWIEADPASRMQHEAIGCFVDPCAFWGMFSPDGLNLGPAKKKPADVVTKKKGDLHQALFVPKIFANRDRIYFDVRNEVGISYDFYGTRQDGLQIGLDQAALAETTYGKSGWPIHFIDPDLTKVAAPASLNFRLRRDDTAEPLLFLRQTGGPPPPCRFVDMIEAGDTKWTKTMTLTRPGDAAALPPWWPPWWFVVHYLRGPAAAQAPAGVFDSSPPQLGPIGDRAISAYRELWPAPGAKPSDGKTVSLFVTDKVLRYDAVAKSDPASATPRALFYDHVAETAYVFRKGTGTDAGKDSVLIVHNRGFERRHDATGTWILPKPLNVWWATDLMSTKLVRRLLASPVTVSLAAGDTVIHSSFDLLNDTAMKTDLFDFTILLLSRADFEAAVEAAAPAGAPPPGPGAKHPIFFTLGPPGEQPAGTSAYGLRWQGWNGQAITGPDAPTLLLSADGIFFCSLNFDAEGLGEVAQAIKVAECPFATSVPFAPHKGEVYDGVPFRIIHHTTQGSTAQGAIDKYSEKDSFPHFTVDETIIYQHIKTSLPSRALKNPKLVGPGVRDVQTNSMNAIQIEVVGTASQEKTKQILMNVARLCRWIENKVGVVREWPAGPPTPLGAEPGKGGRDIDIWLTKGGHYGHCHIPENDHTDPGYTQVEVDFLMNATFTDGILDNPEHAKVKPLLLREGF